MNQLEAMRRCVEILERRVTDGQPMNVAPRHGTSLAHVRSMLERAEEGRKAGTFSDAKLGRWLGYIQGVMVARGVTTLDEMKTLNHLWSGDDQPSEADLWRARCAAHLFLIPPDTTIQEIRDKAKWAQSLVEALRLFADDDSWRAGGPLDPNSGSFRGTEIARKALGEP